MRATCLRIVARVGTGKRFEVAHATATCTVAPVGEARREPDLAEALELRDELLVACREVLLGVGTREASALIAHIDSLLDLDDERSPGSQR